jgi:CRP/FNR family transcriptional regulator, cyclic AMP receptor protein
MEQWVVEAIGYGGTVFTIASYGMRTIIPLRIAGVIASVLFIIYGAAIQSWPVLITELIILPLNTIRLYQVLRLVKQVQRAADGELSADWLAPFARERSCRAGDLVFSAGDAASFLLLIRSGHFRLKEAGIVLGHGELVGELGFLSPGNTRTMTLECVEDGVVGQVSYLDVKQLYFSNPSFAYYFLRLVSHRLFDNLERAQKAQAAS